MFFLCVLFFLATQECKGVSSWRYYPWANWNDARDNGQLKTVTYKKLRNDTILRVTFHSAFTQYSHAKCTEYYIKFGGRECSDPAPIVNTLYLQNYGGSRMGQSYPSQISGFWNSTSAGKLLAGNVQISAHVKMVCSGGDAYTGMYSSGRVTSYLLVEEYCSWVVLCPEKSLVSVKLLLVYSNHYQKILASHFHSFYFLASSPTWSRARAFWISLRINNFQWCVQPLLSDTEWVMQEERLALP